MLGRIFTRCVRRQLLVLPLLLAALPLAAPTLAAELVVDNTEGTVQIHVKNIFAKLGVNDRTGAVQVAVRRGLIHMR